MKNVQYFGDLHNNKHFFVPSLRFNTFFMNTILKYTSTSHAFVKNETQLINLLTTYYLMAVLTGDNYEDDFEDENKPSTPKPVTASEADVADAANVQPEGSTQTFFLKFGLFSGTMSE